MNLAKNLFKIKITDKGIQIKLLFISIKFRRRLNEFILTLKELKSKIDFIEKNHTDSITQIYRNLNFFLDINKCPKARGRLRKLQELNHYLLKNLKNICNDIDIKFWLRGGSALGAYRHMGFIPWDDDIDLGMMREDFDKLVNHLNHHSNTFKIIYYYHRDCKVAKFVLKDHIDTPIFLDIFPYDYCKGQDKLFYKKYVADKRKLVSELSHIKYKENYANKLAKTTISHIERINNKYKIQYNNLPNKTGIISAIEQIYNFSNPRYFNSNVIFPLSTATFENEEYYIPRKIEQYLQIYYGNYMDFPCHINTQQHSFMFDKKNYNKIDKLHNKIIEGKSK